MNTVSAIDFNQLKSLITQCNIDGKIKLIEFLEQNTFSILLNRLLRKLKTNNLSLDEITAEVKVVRQN